MVSLSIGTKQKGNKVLYIDESNKQSGEKRQCKEKKYEYNKSIEKRRYIKKNYVIEDDTKKIQIKKDIGKGTVINVIDAIMGKGKSSSLINYINKSDENKKFLYITPYLEEVDRIKYCCKNKDFNSPEATVGVKKIKSIKKLFKDGKNIVSTHALFMNFDDEIIKLAQDNNYILIMDEVANVVKQLEITKEDSENIIEKYIKVNSDGEIEWCVKNYSGRFDDYKRLCDLGCLSMYGGKIMIWLFPVKTFIAFKEIYMMTYMFDAQLQKYYYDYNNIEYRYMYVVGDTYETYMISYDDDNTGSKYNFKDLITIVDNKKLNNIGEDISALSKTWYDKNIITGAKQVSTIKNNTYNFFRNYCGAKTNYLIWTTFKEYKAQLSGKGYTKGFLSLNARATNKYQNTTSAAYLINVYMNPFIKRFFETKGISVNEDKYALSELLQWLWRTQIRKGKPITVYIPSKRMRTLLINWIEENSPKGE